MKKVSYFKKKKIQKELEKITYDDIKKGEDWLDKDTWICWGILWKPHLLELRKLLDELFDLPKDIESDEGKIMIEWHEDDNEFWYGIFFEDDNITVTDLLSCKHLNELVLKIKNESMNE